MVVATPPQRRSWPLSSGTTLYTYIRRNGPTIVLVSLLTVQLVWIEFAIAPAVSKTHDNTGSKILDIMQQSKKVAIGAQSNTNNDTNINSNNKESAKDKPRNINANGNSNSSANNNKKMKISIFYNLYIGNATDIPRIQQLMSEQLSMRDPLIHTPIYITTIGTIIDDDTLNSFVYGSKKAKNIDVVRLGHYQEGNELLSLESMWGHCSKDENHQEAVVYLHSKGSHSNTMENRQLRLFLTAGALSQDCANGLMPPAATGESNVRQQRQRCNVCSTRFSPIPHPHTSGNMWAARCDYVAQLYQPSKFQQRMRRFHPAGSTPACIGRQRWAAEHWVHTHPAVEPCDLYSSKDFLFNYEHLPNLTSISDVRRVLYGEGSNNNNEHGNANAKSSSSVMILQEAPRFDLETFSSTGICKDTGVSTLNMRLKEARVLYDFTADGTDAAEAGGTGGKDPERTYKIMPKTWWGWKFFNK